MSQLFQLKGNTEPAPQETEECPQNRMHVPCHFALFPTLCWDSDCLFSYHLCEVLSKLFFLGSRLTSLVISVTRLKASHHNHQLDYRYRHPYYRYVGTDRCCYVVSMVDGWSWMSRKSNPVMVWSENTQSVLLHTFGTVHDPSVPGTKIRKIPVRGHQSLHSSTPGTTHRANVLHTRFAAGLHTDRIGNR